MRTRYGSVLGVFLIVAASLLSGCDDPPTPYITSISPAQGAQNVSVYATIVVKFSEPMDAKSFGSTTFGLFNEQLGLPVAGTVSYSGDAAVFTPSSRLAYQTRYRVEISSAIQSAEGASLAESEIVYFTTREENAADENVHVIEPADFSAGRASLTFANVLPTENVVVIPVHATQNFTSGQSTDGFDFEITTSGLLATTTLALKSASEPKEKKVKKKRPHRHSKKFKQRWDALRLLPPEMKKDANLRRSAAPANFGKCKGPYTVGMICQFQVMDANDEFVNVTATLRQVSANAYWFVDNNDSGDFSTTELADLATSFEELAVPVDRRYFGEFPDADANQKIFIVFSGVLIDEQAQSGFLGYVAPWDLYPDGTTTLPSNEGDIFYAVTPAKVQSLGWQRSDYFEDIMPETIVHELKHLIAVGGRLLNNRELEDLWLEEPSAVAAEELAGFGSFTGRTQGTSRYALAYPENFRVVHNGRPATSEEDYSMYGYNFLMLWRVAERLGHDNFWKSWVAGPSYGIANLEQHSGVTFVSTMLDWALTLGFDHAGQLGGYDYQSINLRDGTWQELGVQELSSVVTGSVRSAGYFVGAGLGGNVTIELESNYAAPYFIVVRHAR